MKTPHSTFYRYTPEAIAEANKLPPGTISEHAHKYGMENGEPVIVMMDCLLKYADAYQKRWGSPLCNDEPLAEAFLKAIEAVNAMLDYDGSVALLKDISTDTKDNGAVSSLGVAALKRAGFEEKDL